jgi:hypothetical protein
MPAADTCEVTSFPKTRIGVHDARRFSMLWANGVRITQTASVAMVAMTLAVSCSDSAPRAAVSLPVTTVTGAVASAATPSDAGDFVVEPVADIAPVGFDDVSEGFVVENDLVVAEDFPVALPVELPVELPPTTAYNPNDWTIPLRVTVPYRGFPPIELSIAGTIEVGGISIATPSNWLILRNAEEVQNLGSLNAEVRQRWFNELQSNPSQVFFVRSASLSQSSPTRSGLWVLTGSGLSPKEMISRLTDSVAAQQFKLGSTGYQKWMGRDGVGAVLTGPDGVKRYITVVLLTDKRLLVLQTMGQDEDLGSIHAALLETTKIGAVPLPTTTIYRPPTTAALDLNGKPKVLRN